MSVNGASSSSDLRACALLLSWLLAALLFAGFGGLRSLPFPFPQVVLVGLVVVLLVAYAALPALRGWLAPERASKILGLHLSRFVGIYFLVLYERGELPYGFAVLGGIGDILVAGLALALLLAPSRFRSTRSPWLHAWNVFGLADILFVVATAIRLARASPESMANLTVLPLGLLPTFLVPLIIFTHIVVMLWGARAWRRAG